MYWDKYVSDVYFLKNHDSISYLISSYWAHFGLSTSSRRNQNNQKFRKLYV